MTKVSRIQFYKRTTEKLDSCSSLEEVLVAVNEKMQTRTKGREDKHSYRITILVEEDED